MQLNAERANFHIEALHAAAAQISGNDVKNWEYGTLTYQALSLGQGER